MRRRRREIEQPTKWTVERLSVDCLDIRELKKYGLLCDDRRVLEGHFRWPKIGRIIGSRYRLELEFPDRATTQQIRVSWTRVHLGGWRPWMHCPYCQKRAAILLHGLGGYGCRSCLGNPLYACQARSTHGRRHFELCKIRLLLGGTASPLEPFPDRPRRMHRKTYERMKIRAMELETDLPPRHRGKAVDYRNLAYYAG
jgi:hypothetical protein